MNEVLRGGTAKFCTEGCRRKDASARKTTGTPATGASSIATERDQMSRIASLLRNNGVELEDISKIEKVRISEWQGLTKGEDGEAEIHNLRSASLLLTPTWATGPEWPVVQPAAPVSVRVPQAKAKKVDDGWKTALLLPDPQFGFRRDIYTGQLDPFHDERALDVALQVAEIERPDLTIWLGDVLDLASAGKYQQEPAFALTTQQAIDTAYEYIAQFAALSGETRYIEGNHDIRLQNLIIDNAKAAFGLRKAAAAPTDWPVMSVPNLLRFDELGVEYVGGYPAGATYINDNVAAIHGTKIGNNVRSSASMVVEDERVSVITGHVHHIETRHKTRNTRGAPKFTYAHTPGCLCRIDGSVPSTKGGIDAFNRPVRSWEDWQQGIAVVRYQEGDGKHKLNSVHIEEGWTIYEGRELTAR
jgi:predicted phosphodiesterase